GEKAEEEKICNFVRLLSSKNLKSRGGQYGWIGGSASPEYPTSVQLEKNYYKNVKDYYSNVRKIGLEHGDLDYSKCLDFLLMTVKGLDDQE
ncbi:MAG: hypothetical protein JJU34_05370, partial [Lunatimonas sp.]|nr:hypothetical protein [Lunatimonas sp.]